MAVLPLPPILAKIRAPAPVRHCAPAGLRSPKPWQKVVERGPKLAIALDHRVRVKLGQRDLRVAEGDADHRDLCGFRRGDVELAIADHDGCGRIADRKSDSAEQVIRMWLANWKRVEAGERAEKGQKAQLVEELPR